MPDLLDLDKAKRELEAKDLLTIERETALTWGGRAAASYGFVLTEEDHAEAMRCFWEAETYRGEAVEHAAMTEDADFVAQLTLEVEGHRARARELLLAAGPEFVQGNRTPAAHRGARPMTQPRPSPEGPLTRAQRLADRRHAASSPPPAVSEWTEVPDDEPATTPARPATGMRPPPPTPGVGRRALPESPGQ